MNERDAWIALAATEGVGPVTFERLLTLHGTAANALEAVASVPSRLADRELARMTGVRGRAGLARRLRSAAREPGRTEATVAALGGWLTTPLDADYPGRLHAIEEPPPVLYGLGHRNALGATASVAVVGTRRVTAAGRDLTTRIATRLTEAGATVVSGLALGVDGAAHLAALEAGGATVAVVGSGLDVPGPVSHRRLAQRIIAHGAIISELAPGVRATRGTFPRRNRIISGLCDATIVVEAPARSGALITARHALEQGRSLLVAPGRPLDRHVTGNLALLRESPARPLIGLDEMVVDLGLDRPPPTMDGAVSLTLDGALRLLEPGTRAVAAALATRPCTIDALCRDTGLDPGVVAASLTLLQLRGWARVHGATQLPAGPLVRMDK
jgi:DNA processing protein